ncbi:hypothetical protein J3459_006771 [Metarhizium acridum]|uniref:uncharacterized protein n=1 Tax=Metarhizium acridum TaxID=92637 RepID=UPI001C6B7FB8|nr:hypothetical protein J3458_019192 [Metarhizium acridum]KAG8427377.1 hypothetical protein J3459_006771 [Metarhizium acridum]
MCVIKKTMQQTTSSNLRNSYRGLPYACTDSLGMESMECSGPAHLFQKGQLVQDSKVASVSISPPRVNRLIDSSDAGRQSVGQRGYFASLPSLPSLKLALKDAFGDFVVAARDMGC